MLRRMGILIRGKKKSTIISHDLLDILVSLHLFLTRVGEIGHAEYVRLEGEDMLCEVD